MNERFSPLLHRLAALGLLLITAGAVIILVGLPLSNHFNGLRAEIAQQRELLARFEAFAANKDAAQSLAERSEAAMRSGIFLTGFAKSAASLVPLLEKSPLFSEASLTSPVIFDNQEDKERFSVRIRLGDGAGILDAGTNRAATGGAKL